MSGLLLAQGGASGGSAAAEVTLFWIFAVVAVGAAIAMITLRNLMHAALMLVLNLLAISVLFLVLQSAFLAVIQVIVYAGAIMVLFLFVIMLLGVDRDDLLDSSRSNRVVAAAGGLALAGLLLIAFVPAYTTGASVCAGGSPVAGGEVVSCTGLNQALTANEHGSVGLVADRLFTRYTFPFEASGLLLVVATIGALILGRRHDPPTSEDPAYAPSGRPLPAGDEAATGAHEREPVAEAAATDGGGVHPTGDGPRQGSPPDDPEGGA